jgi:hypothetical protein
MTIPDINSLSGPQFTEKHFQFHYPEFLEFLNEKYKNLNLTFQEKLYWYFNNITERPICKCCGSPTKFNNARIGYREYCSYKCLNSDPNKIKKVEDTCMEKFGTKAPAQNRTVKYKMEQTSLKRYGVKNAMQNKDIAQKSKDILIERYGGPGNSSEIILTKYKETNKQRYGVDNYALTQECKDKMKESCIEKYGVDSYSKTDEFKIKTANTWKTKEITRKDFLIGYTENDEWICKCPHPLCNKCTEKFFICPSGIYRDRVRDHTEPCTKILPVGDDNTKNTSIELFVQQILDEYNIQYKTNARGLMHDKKELDIYIPSKHFAIECNGVLSHSDRYKDHRYHESKTMRCKERNIRLLHIWEDWIRWKPDIVRSMILSKLGCSENKIYARKCIVEICENNSEYLDFLDKNHIQGKSIFKVGLGLRYEGKLVSVMTFGHKRGAVGSSVLKTDKNEWELIRFCSLLNTQVIGAAGKLFKHFVNDYKPNMVYSYASNDISNGNVYDKLGFESDGQINSSYWYIDPKTLIRYHRTSFTKGAIVKKGIKEKNDGTWTERQVMDEAGYLRIYDSGQTKWIWIKKGDQ